MGTSRKDAAIVYGKDREKDSGTPSRFIPPPANLVNVNK